MVERRIVRHDRSDESGLVEDDAHWLQRAALPGLAVYRSDDLGPVLQQDRIVQAELGSH